MFKHILIPTDGSAVANKAVKAGIQFAASVGAKVTIYLALEDAVPYRYSDGYAMPASVLASVERLAKERAAKVLTAAKKLADQANVACDTLSGKAFTPYEGITAAAKKKKCDVIFMASHGRRGLTALLMGSVTQKVLVHSKIPVLVYR
jgi:nucleotide-binding universal stress UspA family protein